MSRESSAGEPKVQNDQPCAAKPLPSAHVMYYNTHEVWFLLQIIYALATLRLIGPGVRLPRGVNRSKLEVSVAVSTVHTTMFREALCPYLYKGGVE